MWENYGNGKKVKFFQDSANKTLIQSHEKKQQKEGTALNFLKLFGRFSWIYLGISLTQQEGFLIFEISNFPI